MYERFAQVYDSLMDDIDYAAWAEYQLRLLATAGVSVKTACDVACGTGSSTIALANLGIKVTGVDMSGAMLWRAAEKARRAGQRIPFAEQDMCALSLPRPVDAIFSMIDGVNYLLTPARLLAFFRAAHAQLRPGGALVFDVSSEKKLRGMDAALFFEERDDLSYFWQNTYDEAACTLQMDLTFFLRQSGELYERFAERQRQRAHTYIELEGLLLKSGFSAVRAYGDRTEAPPEPDAERIFILAVKDREKDESGMYHE